MKTMDESKEFYIQCIRSLYLGLKCENIEDFMENLTPENCFKLGSAYYFNAIVLKKVNEK